MTGSELHQFITFDPCDPVLFIGTRAELIKMSPVLTKLRESDIKIRTIWAGLHSEDSLDLGGVNQTEQFMLWSAKKDQDSIFGVFLWFFTILLKTTICGLMVRRSRNRPRVFIVHGDTLCTVLGSLFAKTAGARLMHIEAGVRSGRFWRPFPEEISRRFVSRLTDVHFAPGARESLNLRQQRGEVINTFHNTSRDALFDAIKDVEFGDDGYLVVTLHRTELLSNKKHFTEIVEEIIHLSKTYEIRWFLGNHERVALESNDIFLRLSMSTVQLFERTSHEDFIRVLARAKCVLTDSGGLQSECNDLGIPVIVHRKESEYTSPDYAPCILTNWKVVVIGAFLSSLQGKTLPRGIRSQTVATEMIVSRIAEEMKGN